MISSLKLRHFKSFSKQTIELRGLNVLIGQNGAGKSNFISLFRFLERLSEQDLQSYVFQNGGVNSFLHKGYENTQDIGVWLELMKDRNANLQNVYDLRIESDGERFQISQESVGYWDKVKYAQPRMFDTRSTPGPESVLKNPLVAGLTSESFSSVSYIRKYLRDLRVFHFHDTSDNAATKVPQAIDDVYHLKSEAENIAPMLLHFSKYHPAEYQRIVEMVRLIYPLFLDFVLEESPHAMGKILLRWREKGSSQVYSVKQMSDGTLRFVCLATLLTQPEGSSYVPGTIVLDEPELGLHPFAIQVLADMLGKATINKQVIVATQSTNLINFVQPEDLIITERNEEGATEMRRPNAEHLEAWLEDYSLGQLWEHNFMGGRP